MDTKLEAWNRFARTGAIADYLKFRSMNNAANTGASEQHANQDGGPGAQNHGYR